MLNGIRIVELFKKNYCLWHIEKKKRIYHWLRSRGLIVYKKLKKGKA